jgi:hypothetical protein
MHSVQPSSFHPEISRLLYVRKNHADFHVDFCDRKQELNVTYWWFFQLNSLAVEMKLIACKVDQLIVGQHDFMIQSIGRIDVCFFLGALHTFIS